MSKRTPRLLPFPGTSPVDYVLAEAFRKREVFWAVAVVALDMEGNPHITFSDASPAEEAAMATALQAAVLSKFQERMK